MHIKCAVYKKFDRNNEPFKSERRTQRSLIGQFFCLHIKNVQSFVHVRAETKKKQTKRIRIK